MKIKDFKNKLKNEKIEVGKISEEVQSKAYLPRVSKNLNYSLINSFKVKKALMYSVIPLLLLVMVLSITLGKRDPIGIQLDEDNGLYSLTCNDDIKRLLQSQETYRYAQGKGQISVNDSSVALNDAEMGPTSSPASNDNSDSSKTTVQVDGVDESDIVKVDGKYIYYVTNGSLYIFETTIEGNIILKKKTPCGESTNTITTNNVITKYSPTKSEMYFTDNYLITISTYGYLSYYTVNTESWIDYIYGYYNEKVVIQVYDKNNFGEVKKYEGYGQIITTRLIGDYFYLLFRSSFTTNKYDLPVSLIDGKYTEHEYTDIKYSLDNINSSYLILVGVELKEKITIGETIQLGGSDYSTNVYCNESAIYISSYNTSPLKVNETVITKYLLNKENFIYDGCISLNGIINDQFSMDEYNGYFRVALSDSTSKDLIYNYLYVLKPITIDKEKTFEIVGTLHDGLGEERESIKSVRFNKDECLIVTFRQTDPLYRIDLTNPKKPVILGYYKEPGYNTYLQYYNDGKLAIGIGYDNGYKIGLYDVSKMVNGEISENAKIDEYLFNIELIGETNIITKRYLYSEAFYNHKAIFSYDNYFGFSIEYSLSYMYNREYELFEIVSKEDSYELKLRKFNDSIIPLDDKTIYDRCSYAAIIERMVYTNEHFFTIGAANVKSYDNQFNLIYDYKL